MNTAYEFVELDNALSKEEKRRRILVQGVIARIPADDLTQSLVTHALNQVSDYFGEPPRKCAALLSKEDRGKFLSQLTLAKAALAKDEQARQLVCRIAVRHLNDAALTCYDQPRLRVVPAALDRADGSRKAVSPSHSCHRDTWYANAQSQINFWLPLHDVSPEETFRFYSDYFDKAVANTSSQFDYSRWSKEIGFGNAEKRASSFYPTVEVDGPRESEGRSFALKQGDLIVFAAAHLHQTVKHHQSLARFSIDFRTVQEGDSQKGITAPSQDNFSRGDACVDYLKMKY